MIRGAGGASSAKRSSGAASKSKARNPLPSGTARASPATAPAMRSPGGDVQRSPAARRWPAAPRGARTGCSGSRPLPGRRRAAGEIAAQREPRVPANAIARTGPREACHAARRPRRRARPPPRHRPPEAPAVASVRHEICEHLEELVQILSEGLEGQIALREEGPPRLPRCALFHLGGREQPPRPQTPNSTTAGTVESTAGSRGRSGRRGPSSGTRVVSSRKGSARARKRNPWTCISTTPTSIRRAPAPIGGAGTRRSARGRRARRRGERARTMRSSSRTPSRSCLRTRTAGVSTAGPARTPSERRQERGCQRQPEHHRG
jgi:hypothetical protein